MSGRRSSAKEFVELLLRKAPETVDLITAENDADFEKAFEALLQKAVIGLETNKTNFEHLDEEGLSAVLALALTMPGLAVTQETNSNGHVDLTIEAEHCMPSRRKLGEAKIYKGPAYHFDGVEQLLGRYTTGREGRGLLVVYFRTKGIGGLIPKLRSKMDQDCPCQQQGDTVDHQLKWSFISKHSHSCGEILEVGHIGINLYIEPVTSTSSSST